MSGAARWMTRAEPSESCLSVTRALCNACGAAVDAKIVAREGRVLLSKWCAQHGKTEALVSSDVDWYRRSLAYVKPATEPRLRRSGTHTACPSECGLCVVHEQHTCVPILEITGRCDLNCPVCLVDRDAQPQISLAEAQRMLDGLIACEGNVNMLTLSGGEPTAHPDFLAIVDVARRPEIGIVSVSTNGVRLAHDDALLEALCERDVVISLQLDGFLPATYTKLRGRADLGDLKRRLIDRVGELGGRLSLTMTLARGVNEHELQSVLDELLNNDRVVSMMIQPVAYTPAASKRFAGDPLDAITIPEVVERVAAASRGQIEPADITPLPCSHPACFALTYLLRLEDGRVLPLPRIIEQDCYLDIIKNQALMGTDTDTLVRVKDSLYTLWSSSGMVPNRDAVMRTVKSLLVDLNALGRKASHRDVLDLGVKHIKSIFIHHFMDRATFDFSRAVKCCNHYPQTDGRLLPACIRNNLAEGLGVGRATAAPKKVS